jgi:hypothetical protein
LPQSRPWAQQLLTGTFTAEARREATRDGVARAALDAAHIGGIPRITRGACGRKDTNDKAPG